MAAVSSKDSVQELIVELEKLKTEFKFYLEVEDGTLEITAENREEPSNPVPKNVTETMTAFFRDGKLSSKVKHLSLIVNFENSKETAQLAKELSKIKTITGLDLLCSVNQYGKSSSLHGFDVMFKNLTRLRILQETDYRLRPDFSLPGLIELIGPEVYDRLEFSPIQNLILSSVLEPEVDQNHFIDQLQGMKVENLEINFYKKPYLLDLILDTVALLPNLEFVDIDVPMHIEDIRIKEFLNRSSFESLTLTAYGNSFAAECIPPNYKLHSVSQVRKGVIQATIGRS